MVKESSEFSLVLGGPLYQLFRRTHLSGDALELLHRRVIAMTLLSWVPLLALSAVAGPLWGTGVQLPFVNDIELHARFLLALPLLIFGELFAYREMRHLTELFLVRGLIPDGMRPGFKAALDSATRLRNSVAAEVLLIALVLVIGIEYWWPRLVTLDLANGVTSWYGTPVAGKFQPSLAGWWLRCVSLPLFQFLLLRWYFRLFIWARFLWHVSRLELRIEPLHPDRCGGLGFLGSISHAFGPLLLAQGILLAGMMAARIFFSAAQLPDFKLDLIGLPCAMLLIILGPLLVFGPKLASAKRDGKREYGTLAMQYARDFRHKWLRGDAPPNEPLIGSADIQSLADLGSSFEVAQSMRLVPFNLNTVVGLSVTTLLPVLPLIFTMFSPEQILGKVLSTIF